jgi:anti-anti-sigma factor
VPAVRVIPRETATVALSGEFDLAGSAQLADAIARAVVRGGPLLVEMDGVTFMDLSAVRAIVHAAKALEPECVVLQGMPPQVERVLGLMGWDGVSNIHVVPCCDLHAGIAEEAGADGQGGPRGSSIAR